MLDWLSDNQTLLWLAAAASVVIFIASLLAIPPIVARIRPDYFIHDRRPPSRWSQQRALVRIPLLIAKNFLGIVLLIAGVAMLALPGQGLLTMLVGFLLIDFPGKYRLERWLVSRRSVARPINWLRRRAGREPLQQRPPR